MSGRVASPAVGNRDQNYRDDLHSPIHGIENEPSHGSRPETSLKRRTERWTRIEVAGLSSHPIIDSGGGAAGSSNGVARPLLSPIDDIGGGYVAHRRPRCESEVGDRRPEGVLFVSEHRHRTGPCRRWPTPTVMYDARPAQRGVAVPTGEGSPRRTRNASLRGQPVLHLCTGGRRGSVRSARCAAGDTRRRVEPAESVDVRSPLPLSPPRSTIRSTAIPSFRGGAAGRGTRGADGPGGRSLRPVMSPPTSQRT